MSYKAHFPHKTLLLILAGIAMILLASRCDGGQGPSDEPSPCEKGATDIANCAGACGSTLDPVCGTDGEIYRNACVAECNCVEIAIDGSCGLCKLGKDVYRDKGLKKVRLLNEYISLLTNKIGNDVSKDDKDLAVENATGLFISDQAQVAVSGADDINYFAIGDYLDRVRNYAYANVEVTWSEIGYISELKKGKDGNFYGVISVTQVFKGTDDEGNVIYEDATEKRVEIVLKPFTVTKAGKIEPDCDVYLSDIGVFDTWYTK